jgi:hypothetical protein
MGVARDQWCALKRIFADHVIYVLAFLARSWPPMAGEVAVTAAFWDPLHGAARRSKKPFGKITLDSAEWNSRNKQRAAPAHSLYDHRHQIFPLEWGNLGATLLHRFIGSPLTAADSARKRNLFIWKCLISQRHIHFFRSRAALGGAPKAEKGLFRHLYPRTKRRIYTYRNTAVNDGWWSLPSVPDSINWK